MSIPWTDVENALHGWLSTAIGGPVVWANQKAPKIVGTFGTLQVISADVMDFAEIHTTTDDSHDPPVEITALAHIEFQVSAQIFAARGSPSNITGSNSAYGLLTNARLRLYLESVREALDAVNVVFVDAAAVQNLTALLETEWESRAALTARFRTRDAVSDFVTYIEEINGGAGPTGTFTGSRIIGVID